MKTVTGEYVQRCLSDSFAKAAFARIEEMGSPLWSIEQASDRKDGHVVAFPNILEWSMRKEIGATIKAEPCADFNAAVINAYRVLENIGAQPFTALLANPYAAAVPAGIDIGHGAQGLYVTDRVLGAIVRKSA